MSCSVNKSLLACKMAEYMVEQSCEEMWAKVTQELLRR